MSTKPKPIPLDTDPPIDVEVLRNCTPPTPAPTPEAWQRRKFLRLADRWQQCKRRRLYKNFLICANSSRCVAQYLTHYTKCLLVISIWLQLNPSVAKNNMLPVCWPRGFTHKDHR
jgi:hypothetical protein